MFASQLPRWQQLVTPAWLAELLAGRKVTAAPSREWCLFEVGFDAADLFASGHIPGAGYMDTLQLEEGPLWNKVSDDVLLRLLLDNGIRHDTTVLLYGRNTLSAARAAHLLLYAGVEDVRLLDGGLGAWKDAGQALSSAPPVQRESVSDFGVAMPAHPEYLMNLDQVRDALRRNDGVLASIRTWDEFIGQTSGYSYIEAAGDIPGARWGRAGKNGNVNCMSDFHKPDGTMRPPAEILEFWNRSGIAPGQRTIFYCGTGWRASLAFFYAWLMNWEEISVFDGGWCEWAASAQ